MLNRQEYSIHDQTYFDIALEVLNYGLHRTDRTGTGTKSIFSHSETFDLEYGFPLLTTKKLNWSAIVWELIFFLEGRTNIRWLQERGVHIWDHWADSDGELGPVYGAQWRAWPALDGKPIDQLQHVIDTIRTNPTDRRLLVSAWNASQIPSMRLPPCHCFFQFYVNNDRTLDCMMYQRSVDVFLGLPFNIASYALLIHIVAHLTDLQPGALHWVGGDVHIYDNHQDQISLQLSRRPRPAPTLLLRKGAPRTLEGWTLDHFDLNEYNPHPSIKAPIAV